MTQIAATLPSANGSALNPSGAFEPGQSNTVPSNTTTTRKILEPKRLARLATLGFQKMHHFRKARMAMMTQYVGRFYSSRSASGEDRAFPLNLMHQAVTTIVPNLVYSDPKSDINAEFMEYKDYAEISQLALNYLVDKIELRHTLRKVITDAIFLAGFLKCGLAVSGQYLEVGGFLHDLGQPYCDRVDPDDMVLDPIARQWEEQRFVGNRFRADLQTLQDSGMYDADKLGKLSSRYAGIIMQNEASTLSNVPGLYESDSLVPAADLVELWIPSEKLIVTLPWLPGNIVGDEFLNVVEYEGPDKGPYSMLGFAFVPDNILPVAPAMIWHDLHMMVNKVARKAARQAERQKSVLAYESSAWQDAQEVVDSDDGESVRVDQIDAIKEISYGGTVDNNYKYLDWAQHKFAEMSMNSDMLAGQQGTDNTATQAEIRQTNSSVRLGDMQGIVYQFTAEAMKQLFYFLHTDPLIELPLTRRVKGLDQQAFYTPEMRRGEWIDYNIKVRPYSMARQDPNTKIRRLMEFSSNVIPALVQAFQMLGPVFNIEAAINLIGREMGIEELDEIINSPALHAQLEMLQGTTAMVVPPDQKPQQMSQLAMMLRQTGIGGMGGIGNMGGMGGPPMGGVRPQQPNPRAGMAAGIGPGQERNQRRQDGAPQPRG